MFRTQSSSLLSSSLLAAAAAVSLFALGACAPATDDGEQVADSAWLAPVLAGDQRSDDERARDQYRNPAETLAFFGLQPDSTVVEIWPGGGWYTKVIAPAVNEQGQFYAAHFDPDSEIPMLRKALAKYQGLLDSRPELYGKVQMTVLQPPAKTEIAPAGSADLVVSFRSVHNWMAFGMQDQVMTAIFDALKPGGVFGVVEHRGPAGTEQDPKAKSGYVTEAYMIELAERAGFVLDAKSEVNANPADTKDWPEGVWTLPPRLKLGEQDREKYLAVGESDRFTLRFVKPQ